MTDVVSMIEYRLIRPDGTLLWTTVAPNYMPIPMPIPEPAAVGLRRGPAEWLALPPWRYEARERGGEWKLLASDPQVGGE